MAEREWGVRLADIRLPRAWPVAVVLSTLIARRYRDAQVQRAVSTLERPMREAAEYVHDRDHEASVCETRLLALTETLARLTWALLMLTIATLAVAIVTLAIR